MSYKRKQINVLKRKRKKRHISKIISNKIYVYLNLFNCFRVLNPYLLQFPYVLGHCVQYSDSKFWIHGYTCKKYIGTLRKEITVDIVLIMSVTILIVLLLIAFIRNSLRMISKYNNNIKY